jgi:cold shock CspA family protein
MVARRRAHLCARLGDDWHREVVQFAKRVWIYSASGCGGKDVFVHISAVEKTGLSSLNEGQIVEYQEVANKGKVSAENLKIKQFAKARRTRAAE